ncbi:MAG: hypothetical protein Q8L47_00885 [bacterium]|nr:hypothetical protein [bacterium]
MYPGDEVLMIRYCSRCMKEYFGDINHKECSTHDVRFDYYGLDSLYRITCYTIGCCTATLIRQKKETQEDWDKRLYNYLIIHPTTEIKDESY